MTEAAQIAAQVKHVLPHLKSGTLRFFGDWFGRPMDNWHTITDVSAQDDCLMVRFGGGEALRVWSPQGFTGDEQTFRIRRASRVLWEWYYYGRPHVPENLYYREYVVKESRIQTRTNV